MAQLNIQDILKMLGSNPSSEEMLRMGQMVNPASTGAQLTGSEMARMIQPTDEQARKAMMAQAMGSAEMGSSPTLSLQANEMQPNYADGQMPLYTGGLLQNPQGDMIDPQQLMNVAYDMNAPREMRINAIERLRALGVQ